MTIGIAPNRRFVFETVTHLTRASRAARVAAAACAPCSSAHSRSRATCRPAALTAAGRIHLFVQAKTRAEL